MTRREQHLLGVGDALAASVKWRGERMEQYAGENARLTKRCEVATVWMEHYTSCEKFFEDEDDDDECTCGLDEWLDEGKP